ncbi:winged helix-turn-helix transcriptional regulator [Nonomuraea thailandensis]
MAELVGRRWTSAILLAGQRGARRFSEYHLSVPGISDRLLAQRLKEVGGACGAAAQRRRPVTFLTCGYQPPRAPDRARPRDIPAAYRRAVVWRTAPIGCGSGEHDGGPGVPVPTSRSSRAARRWTRGRPS